MNRLAPSLEALHRSLSGLVEVGRWGAAAELIIEQFDEGDAAMRHWLRRAVIPVVFERLPAAAFSKPRTDFLKKSCAMGARAPLPPPVGSFRLPAALDGTATLVTVTVESGRGETPPEYRALLDETARGAISEALDAARAVTGDPLSGYAVTGISPAIPLGGASIGLAVGLAALSRFRREAPRDDYCATGALARGGFVKPVGSMPEKLRGLAVEWPRGILIVAAEERVSRDDDYPWVEPVGTLREAAAKVWSVPAAIDIDATLRKVEELVYTGHSKEGVTAARSLLANARLGAHELLNLWVHMLAAANHTADDNLADEAWGEIERRIEHSELFSARVAADLHAVRAVRALDRFATGEDEQAWRQLLQSQAAHWTAPHEGFAKGVCLATLAMFSAAATDYVEAAKLQREANELIPSHERARGLCNLGNWLTKAGELDEAEDVLEEALDAVRDIYDRGRHEYARRTERFIRFARARRARLAGDVAGALRELEGAEPNIGLDPGLRLGLERAIALQSRDALALAASAIPPTPATKPLIMSLVARAGLALARRPGERAAVLDELAAIPGFGARYPELIARARSEDEDAVRALVDVGPY